MAYKLPRFTPEITRARTEAFVLAQGGFENKQELQDLADLGVDGAETLLLSVNTFVDEQVTIYHPKGTFSNGR